MAVLLAVALFSVILDHAKGLSASPQHSRYFEAIHILRKHFLFYQPQQFAEFFEHFYLCTKNFNLQHENFIKM